ncbi:hypothetical protein D7W36_23370 [Escherichia coli]|nr:hypothetical protein [Escherichia coli]GDR21978.1 hypothetical protein BvCmsOUNP033_04734 [Escherichia coli]
MNETLNALIYRHARNLLLAQGWPAVSGSRFRYFRQTERRCLSRMPVNGWQKTKSGPFLMRCAMQYAVSVAGWQKIRGVSGRR